MGGVMFLWTQGRMYIFGLEGDCGTSKSAISRLNNNIILLTLEYRCMGLASCTVCYVRGPPDRRTETSNGEGVVKYLQKLASPLGAFSLWLSDIVGHYSV